MSKLVTLPGVVYCSWGLPAGDEGWDKTMSWGKAVRGEDLCNLLEMGRWMEKGVKGKGDSSRWSLAELGMRLRDWIWRS